MYALMSGKCTTLKIAGSDFACKAVAYFHSQQGRAHFTIVLDDPRDASHIISFSGENGRRDQDNVYELQVDKMLLNSKDSRRSTACRCRQPNRRPAPASRSASSRRDPFPAFPVSRPRKAARSTNCNSSPTARRSPCERSGNPRSRKRSAAPKKSSNSNAAARPTSPRCCRGIGLRSLFGASRMMGRRRRGWGRSEGMRGVVTIAHADSRHRTPPFIDDREADSGL
jgi:hypothetical protein